MYIYNLKETAKYYIPRVQPQDSMGTFQYRRQFTLD